MIWLWLHLSRCLTLGQSRVLWAVCFPSTRAEYGAGHTVIMPISCFWSDCQDGHACITFTYIQSHPETALAKDSVSSQVHTTEEQDALMHQDSTLHLQDFHTSRDKDSLVGYDKDFAYTDFCRIKLIIQTEMVRVKSTMGSGVLEGCVCNKPKTVRFLRGRERDQIQLSIFRLHLPFLSYARFFTLGLDCILYPHINETIFRAAVSQLLLPGVLTL